MPNVALDILVNVVKTKILLIFISLSSLVFIFVLVLVSSTMIQNVFVIFVIVFVVVDEKTLVLTVSLTQSTAFDGARHQSTANIGSPSTAVDDVSENATFFR